MPRWGKTRVMSHMWMCDVTHMGVPCHIYERVMAHTWMRWYAEVRRNQKHVTHLNVPCHTYECHMFHTRIWHGTYMSKSCMSMSYIWAGHGTHVNTAIRWCEAKPWVVWHMWMCYVAWMSESWHTYKCDSMLTWGETWAMSHVWMCHVTHMEVVISHTRIWHVTHLSGLWHTHECISTLMWRETWVMLHVWMCHVTHRIGSWYTCEWSGMMSHGTHVSVALFWCEAKPTSCHTYDYVTSHIWMRHVTLMDLACQTYERVMAHLWTRQHVEMKNMSHVTRMTASCHTCECVMTHV